MKLNIQLFAYTKKEWKDLPSKDTPIFAADLNNIENGIATASNDVYTKTEIDEKENNLKAENEYLNSLIEQAFTPVEKEGTSIKYDNTINARFKDIKLCGGTTQNGTPTPDTPVPVEVVTGEQKITISSGESKQEYPLSLGSMELCKLGDYQDYIHKDNGKWYLNKQIGKVVLNGSEDIKNDVYNNIYQFSFRVSNPLNNIYSKTTSSNYFKGVDWSGSWEIDNSCVIIIEDDKLRIMTSKYTNANDFKAFLKEKYNNNKPIICYYILATPTNTEITDTTLLEQLEELAGATTYAGETNIVATSDGLTIIPKTTALTK